MARGSRSDRPALRDDPNRGPSTDWGWHGSLPRGYRIAGFASVGVLIALLLTTRDFQLGAMVVPWLVGIAAVLTLALLLGLRRRR